MLFSRRAFSVAIILPLASIASASTSEHDSLVRNGGFELAPNAGSNEVPEWRTDGASPDRGLDRRYRHKGKTSLRISFREGYSENGYSGVTQRLALKSGVQSLRLVGYVRKNTEAAKAGIWIGAFDSNKTRLAYENTYESSAHDENRWVSHSVTLQVPPSTSYLLIGASVFGSDGTMWVDDVRVIANGS